MQRKKGKKCWIQCWLHLFCFLQAAEPAYQIWRTQIGCQHCLWEMMRTNKRGMYVNLSILNFQHYTLVISVWFSVLHSHSVNSTKWLFLFKNEFFILDLNIFMSQSVTIDWKNVRQWATQWIGLQHLHLFYF